MNERDGYPPGVPCWVETGQPDPDAAMAFYGGLFGWEFQEATPPGSPQPYFIAQLRGRDVAGVGSQPDAMPGTPAWSTYIGVESADETVASVSEEGGQVVMEPVDVGPAGRMGVVADPAGATFCVWQAGHRRGAQVVNEPGSWNFSELNTRDPKGARAFYGAVFGWETSDRATQEGDFWRRPGYADFLELSDPDLHKRHADVGAPEGFEEAVAWLLPMTRERFPEDTPSHWSTTFGVDDADAIADRATELGGKVLVPPMDAPWVRLAVISDPQGAVFTASRFTPPG